MVLRLSEDLQSFLEEQVRQGKYASADAVVSEAVQRMKEHEEKLTWLRRELQHGIDQADRGETVEWNPEAMKARLRAKYPMA